MSWLGEQKRRIGNLVHRRRWRRELDLEMALHRELRDEPRKFGNGLLLRERSQAMWGWTWLESWGQDVRHGLRLLARTPLVTALALLSLTLGIGANTALFSLMDAVLLRPLPVAQPQQLVQIFIQGPKSPRPYPAFSNPLWEQIRDRQTALTGVFAWSMAQFQLAAGGAGQPVLGAYASGDYFRTLGVTAERGRLFDRRDDYRGCPAIAVISDAFWHSHYAASPAAVGSGLNLTGHLFRVIGVLPADFFGMESGLRSDVTVPLCTQALSPQPMLDQRAAWWLDLGGRLPPAGTLRAAEAQLRVLGPPSLAAAVPPDYTAAEAHDYLDRWLSLAPGGTGTSLLRSRYGLPLQVLLAIAALVLLVACANLAGLMLARAAARRQEIAVRRALGASRTRLIRQLLTESVLLAAGGAGLGAGFAVWACAAVQRVWSSSALEVHLNLSPDASMLAFVTGLTVVTVLLVGLAPALRATRLSLATQARQDAESAGRGGRGVVAAQLALSLLLLAGAGMFLRSFVNLAGVPKGFDPDHLYLVSMDVPPTAEADATLGAERTHALAFLRALPGVSAASESFNIPVSGVQWHDTLQTAGGPSQAAIADAYLNAISVGYFATLRTPVLSGREFSQQDRAGAAPVVILNETAARQLFPHGAALGRLAQLPAGTYYPAPTRVIGIVADAKYQSLRDPDPPTAYYPLAQLPHRFPTTAYELRSPLPEQVLTSEVRSAFARDAPAARFDMGTMQRQLAAGIKPERLLAWLSGLFGGLALLLTAIGLYGTAAFEASRRRREFGIRMALGARPVAIVRLAVAGLGPVLGLGALAGIVAAWWAARALQATLAKLLFELAPTDWINLVGAASLLAAVALLAAWLPARRAAGADPMRALREE